MGGIDERWKAGDEQPEYITHVTGAEGPQVAMATETGDNGWRVSGSQQHPSPTEGPSARGTAR